MYVPVAPAAAPVTTCVILPVGPNFRSYVVVFAPKVQVVEPLTGTFTAASAGLGVVGGRGVPAAGGEKVNVKPAEGVTVELIKQVAVLILPAVVAAQLVVVVLLK